MIDFGYGVYQGTLNFKHQDMIRAWRNDERVWKWCRQFDLINECAHSAWYERQASDPATRMYAINIDERILGVCGLTSVDYVNRRAEFSLYIAPEQQKAGLGKKALKTLLQHGFMNLGLNCIWGETFDGNPAASMFEKLGMKKEGTRRDFYYRSGRFIDAHLYSFLRRDFDSVLPDWEKGRAYPRPEVGVFVGAAGGPKYSDVRPFAIQTG